MPETSEVPSRSPKPHRFNDTDRALALATLAEKRKKTTPTDEPVEKAYESSKQRWGEIERRFQEDISQARKGNAKKDSHLIRNLVVSAGVAHDKAYAKQVEAGMQLETPPIIIERMLILIQSHTNTPTPSGIEAHDIMSTPTVSESVEITGS